jgi:hypothetical protein
MHFQHYLIKYFIISSDLPTILNNTYYASYISYILKASLVPLDPRENKAKNHWPHIILFVVPKKSYSVYIWVHVSVLISFFY